MLLFDHCEQFPAVKNQSGLPQSFLACPRLKAPSSFAAQLPKAARKWPRSAVKTIQGARIPEWIQTALSGLLLSSLNTFYPDVALLAQLGRQMMAFPINLLFLSSSKIASRKWQFSAVYWSSLQKCSSQREEGFPNDSERDSKRTPK